MLSISIFSLSKQTGVKDKAHRTNKEMVLTVTKGRTFISVKCLTEERVS